MAVLFYLRGNKLLLLFAKYESKTGFKKQNEERFIPKKKKHLILTVAQKRSKSRNANKQPRKQTTALTFAANNCSQSSTTPKQPEQHLRSLNKHTPES